MLTKKDFIFLQEHLFPDIACVCKEPVGDRLKSLVDRGYCKFSPARLGPLGIYNGETMISLTEAGKQLLVFAQAKCLYPGELFL
jgi:hypothetical protein